MEQTETMHVQAPETANHSETRMTLPVRRRAGMIEASAAVTVDIYDQTYHLHGQDAAYIDTLASIVDGKMRAVAAGGTTVDSLRVAVLAALNIADQMIRIEAKYRALSGSVVETESTLRHRADNLSGLLDTILSEDRKAG